MTPEPFDPSRLHGLLPCPKCKSDDVVIVGTKFPQGYCRNCQFYSEPITHGSGESLIKAAKREWNRLERK